MSILIKGMEMPTNCENCRFWYQDQDSEHNVWSRCTALNHNEIITFRTMRRSDCPLVEVEPVKRQGNNFVFEYISGNQEPTIIEAEEEEDDSLKVQSR